MHTQLTFITGNKGKFSEVAMLLPSVELVQQDLDLTEVQHIDPHVIIRHKLEEALAHVEGNVMVEDTSLYLDCLNGLPGPLIKWFLKTMKEQGLYALAQALGNYGAEAKVVIGYAKSNEQVEFFEGVARGTIVSPRGTNGFAWDVIFKPDGYDKTFAEMTREEKNATSMRKIAVEKLEDYLTEQN